MITPEISLDEWVSLERQKANERIERLAQALSGTADVAIALTMPEHGTTLADTDENPGYYSYLLPPIARTKADATLTRESRKGLLFNPADCPIVNLAYYQHSEVGAIAQIHAGAAGLALNVIAKVVRELQTKGLAASSALAYISPHSRQFTLYGTAYERAVAAGLGAYFSEVPAVEQPQRYLFDMTQASIDQLTDAGVSVDRIDTLPIDTMSDPRYYSQRRQSTEAASSQAENPDVPPFARNGFMLMKTS